VALSICLARKVLKNKVNVKVYNTLSKMLKQGNGFVRPLFVGRSVDDTFDGKDSKVISLT
jgi:hypothetical protein